MEKKVLATVGEKEITNIDIENALKSLDPYQAMQFKTEEGKKHLLNDLVNQELF
ncbi:TPA: peptidylprolyl isomerase, partial [Clostridioides difficile]|nr:peptidylprolyl isomerase [Clostridioides difficile]